MREGWGRPLDEALSLERAVFNRLFRSDDARSGVLAFMAKEQPVFRGS